MNGKLSCLSMYIHCVEKVLTITVFSMMVDVALLQVAYILVQECPNADNLLASAFVSLQSVPSEVPRHWKALASPCKRIKICFITNSHSIWCLSSPILNAQRSTASWHQPIPDILDGCFCWLLFVLVYMGCDSRLGTRSTKVSIPRSAADVSKTHLLLLRHCDRFG